MEITQKDIHCYKCSKDLPLELNARLSRQEECHHCSASLHCCKMCKFYNISSYNECFEPVANRIVDKEKSNFCDFFKLDDGGQACSSTEELVFAANSLFKN